MVGDMAQNDRGHAQRAMPVSAVRRRSCADHGAMPNRPSGRSFAGFVGPQDRPRYCPAAASPCRTEKAAAPSPCVGHRFLDNLERQIEKAGQHARARFLCGCRASRHSRAFRSSSAGDDAGDLADPLRSDKAKLDDRWHCDDVAAPWAARSKAL